MRRIRALIVVTAAIALLGACSGSLSTNSEPASGSWPTTVAPRTPRTTATAVRRIAGSTEATAAVRTARFAYSIDAAGDGEQATVGATGAIDFERQNLSMRLEVSGFGIGGSANGTAEVRAVDGVFYLDLGDLGDATSELPEGTRWLKLDLGRLTYALGGHPLIATSNPIDGLEALRGVSSDVEEIGPDVLRGVETTHYRATVDLAVETQIPVDVWLDAQDRVRKFTMRIDGSIVGESDATATATYELYDFGAPVEVGAPPAAEVADIGSMFGDLFDGFLDDLTGGSTDTI